MFCLFKFAGILELFTDIFELFKVFWVLMFALVFEVISVDEVGDLNMGCCFLFWFWNGSLLALFGLFDDDDEDDAERLLEILLLALFFICLSQI